MTFLWKSVKTSLISGNTFATYCIRPVASRMCFTTLSSKTCLSSFAGTSFLKAPRSCNDA